MFDINSIPPYLGFGRLEPETQTETDTKISADYYFRDKAAHRAIYRKKDDCWRLKDIFDSSGWLCGRKTLEQATLIRFNNLDCLKDSLFQYMVSEVCGLGNISFYDLASKNDTGGTVNYYPAGRLVIFRLPVIKHSSEERKVDFLTQNIEYINEEGRRLLRLNDTYDSSIIITRKSGKTEVIPVQMFEYLITLASVYEAAEWICRNNLISKEKHLRMIIQDVKHKSGMSLKIYQGAPKDSYCAYTILLKGIATTMAEFSEFNDTAILLHRMDQKASSVKN